MRTEHRAWFRASGPPRSAVIKVDSNPTGKGRPRFNRKTGRVYTPAETAQAEREVQAAWREAGSPTFEGPLRVSVHAWIPRPKSHWKKNGELSAAGLRKPHATVKPDNDNLEKLIWDALSGRAFDDDKNIVYSQVSKDWALTGRGHTTIRIESMEDR